MAEVAPGIEVGDTEDRALGQLEGGPGKRQRDGAADAGAGRERGDGGGAALVAEVVEVDFAGAGGLGHFGEVERGVGALHGEDEVVRGLFDGGPVMLGVDGRDDVEALAAGGLEEAFEAGALEALADLGGGGAEGGPGEGFVGVEVEDEAVGVLEVVVFGAPGVDFEDAHLGEAGEGFGLGVGGGDGDVGLGHAGLFVGDVDAGDAGRERVVDVLLEEAGLAGALGAADERERAVDDVWEHAVGDGEVVVGELALGEVGAGVEDLVGVGEAERRGKALPQGLKPLSCWHP